jgi:hypothetical protein
MTPHYPGLVQALQNKNHGIPDEKLDRSSFWRGPGSVKSTTNQKHKDGLKMVKQRKKNPNGWAYNGKYYIIDIKKILNNTVNLDRGSF